MRKEPKNSASIQLKNPEAVLIDGKQVLLAKVMHKKTEEEYIKQYQNAEKYFTKFRALSYLSLPYRDNEDGIPDHITKIFLDATKDKAWGIRDLAIENLKKYQGEKLNDALFSRLKEMAMTEEKSVVRAEVLYLLSEKYPNKATREFEENISAKSYLVSAEALNGYLKSGGGSKDLYLNQYINSEKQPYISVISEYFAANPTKDDLIWFEEKLNNKDLIGYDMLFNYTNFLKGLNDGPATNNGIEKIKKIAMNNEFPFWTKISAFQSLLNFENNKVAEAAMTEIKENETNERLKQFYMYF